MSWSYICLHVVDGHRRNSSCTLGYSCTWWGDVKTLCKLTSGTHVLTAILFIYLCFFSRSKHRHEKSHLVTQNTNHHAQFHKTLVTKQNNDSENTCTWWGDVKTLSKLTFCSSGRIVFCFFSRSKCRHEKSVFVTQNSHHAQFHKTLVTKQNNDLENSCTWWGDVKTLLKPTFWYTYSSDRKFIFFFPCSKHTHKKSVFVTQNSNPSCTISQNPHDKAN
jgi:hypothetical protein